jgi:hypothetical protein
LVTFSNQEYYYSSRATPVRHEAHNTPVDFGKELNNQSITQKWKLEL